MSEEPPELSTLRLLILVAETGSLGRAAARMGISQPAASKRLSLLERRLGLALVDRDSRGSVLTTHGKAVCQWSTKVLAEMDTLMAGAAALRQQEAGELRLASSMTLAEHWVPRWIGALQQAGPQVFVSLAVSNSEQVAQLAATGRVDLGFVESPGLPPGLSSRQVGADRLVVVVAPGHPWARRREPVDPADLAATRLIVREPGSGTRETFERALAAAGEKQTKALMELDANAAVRAAVAAGGGPAVLSALTVQDDLTARRLVEVPVAGVELSRRLRAVWAKGTRLSKPAEQLLRIAVRAGRAGENSQDHHRN